MDIYLFEDQWNLIFSCGKDQLRRVTRFQPIVILLNTNQFLEVIREYSIKEFLKICHSENLGFMIHDLIIDILQHLLLPIFGEFTRGVNSHYPPILSFRD
jgi:hypothetical protein